MVGSLRVFSEKGSPVISLHNVSMSFIMTQKHFSRSQQLCSHYCPTSWSLAPAASSKCKFHKTFVLVVFRSPPNPVSQRNLSQWKETENHPQAHTCHGVCLIFFFSYLELFSFRLPVHGMQCELNVVRDLRFLLSCALAQSSARCVLAPWYISPATWA